MPPSQQLTPQHCHPCHPSVRPLVPVVYSLHNRTLNPAGILPTLKPLLCFHIFVWVRRNSASRCHSLLTVLCLSLSIYLPPSVLCIQHAVVDFSWKSPCWADLKGLYLSELCLCLCCISLNGIFYLYWETNDLRHRFLWFLIKSYGLECYSWCLAESTTVSLSVMCSFS